MKRKKNGLNRNDNKVQNISRAVLILFVFLSLYPIIFVLLTSLKSTQEFYRNIWLFPNKIAWSNFSNAWVTAHLGSYFAASFIVVGVSVALIVVFGAMGGYALARLKIPYAELIMALILSTTILPSESVIMPLFLMMSKLKLLGGYHTLIIPYVGWGLPMTVFIFKNFFHTIPADLLDSARVDGCNETQTFVKITGPLMLPAIATVAIINFVGFWGELLWASVAFSTQTTIRTIPMGIISFQSQFATDWGPLSAAICIILIPLIVFFLFVQKYFVQGLTGGAIKG